MNFARNQVKPSNFPSSCYRIVTKVPRRNCMHRGSDATNGLGILPLDYVDRGDGLLIGLESLTAVNRTLLAPKNCSVSLKALFTFGMYYLYKF